MIPTTHTHTHTHTHCRRGKDFSRPVGFVSAGVHGGGQDDEEGKSDSDNEVQWVPLNIIFFSRIFCLISKNPKPFLILLLCALLFGYCHKNDRILS